MRQIFAILILTTSFGASGQAVDSLRTVLDTRSGSDRIEVLHKLIYATWLNSPNESLKYAKEARSLSQLSNDAAKEAKSVRLLGGVYSYLNDYEKAFEYAYKSLDLALNNQDSINISASYNNIGHMNINLGNYPDALEYLMRARVIKENFGMEKNLPLAYSNIGRVYYEMMDYPIALEYFNKALDKAKSLGDKNQMVYALNNLGNTYLKEGNTMEAYNSFKESIEMCKTFDNKNWQSVAFRGMGITFLQDKQYDSAQLCFVKSEKLSDIIGDKIGSSEAYYQQALLNWEKKNIESTLAFLAKSQGIVEEIGARKQIIDNLKLYMDVYSEQEQLESFYKYQKLYTNFKDSILYQSTLRNISLIPIKLKQEETNLNLFKKQTQLRRSKLINRQYGVIIVITTILLLIVARLYFKYRKANKVLKLVNYEIAAQKEEIQTQNEELTEQGEELNAQRERLEEVNQLVSLKNDQLQDYAVTLEKKIDHRSGQLAVLNKDLLNQNLKLEQFNFITVHNLRAPIAQIMGLLNILPQETLDSCSSMQGIVDKIKVSITDLDEIVRDLNVILTIRKGTPDKIVKIDLKEELEIVIKSLHDDLNKINASLEIPNESYYISGVNAHIRSILYNIIHNAIKFHSLKRQPSIKISMEKMADNLKLIIEDNGIGIDMKYAKTKIFQLYQRFNTEYQGKGLGLYIVKNQVNVMDGTIEVESELDTFTRIIITLPNG